jgi:hypothetical protein
MGLTRASADLRAVRSVLPRQGGGRWFEPSIVHPNGGFTLVEVTNPRVLEALGRIDAMSDEEIRELVRGEPRIIVEAGEGIIADRRAEQAGSERTS